MNGGLAQQNLKGCRRNNVPEMICGVRRWLALDASPSLAQTDQHRFYTIEIRDNDWQMCGYNGTNLFSFGVGATAFQLKRLGFDKRYCSCLSRRSNYELP